MRNALVRSLSRWADRSLAVGGEHCLELRPRFRIPGAGSVDLLSVRHVRDQFVVGLWAIQAVPLGERAVDGMTRRIHAFEALYGELLEHAETLGFRPAHRVCVCGHLVGPSVRRNGLIDLLSNWGGSICFWTWKKSAAGTFELAPYYGKAPALEAGRRQLKGLLSHLPWKDVSDAEEAEPARGVPRKASVSPRVPPTPS
jgi:hypothetical protein